MIDRSRFRTTILCLTNLPAQERSLAKPGAMFLRWFGGQCMVWVWNLKKAYEMIWIVPIRSPVTPAFQRCTRDAKSFAETVPPKMWHCYCDHHGKWNRTMFAGNWPCDSKPLSCWFPAAGPIRRLLRANITAGWQPKITNSRPPPCHLIRLKAEPRQEFTVIGECHDASICGSLKLRAS